MMDDGMVVDGPDPDAIGGDFSPCRRDTVASVEIDGEAVLYDEEAGAMHLLNPTATILWSLCDGSSTVDELVAGLSDAFSTDITVVRADVLTAIRHMVTQGLLTA